MTEPRHTLIRTASYEADPSEVGRVRLRYHAEPLACRALVQPGGRVVLELEQAAHAVAPGQLACLMRDDCVVGEGTIGEPA